MLVRRTGLVIPERRLRRIGIAQQEAFQSLTIPDRAPPFRDDVRGGLTDSSLCLGVRPGVFRLLHGVLEHRDPLLLIRRQLPLRIEPLQDRQPARQMMALIHRPCLGKLPRAHNQIRLPNHIVGVARRELLCNVEAVLIGFERAVAVAAGGADVADLVIADGEIALPFGVVGIARRELLSNVEAVLIGFERAVAVAAGGADVADAVIADGEIALPFGVVGSCRAGAGRALGRARSFSALPLGCRARPPRRPAGKSSNG